VEADFFDRNIKEQWPNLETGIMLPWITSDETYPNGILYSPQEQSRLILCNADAFNDMVSGSPTLDCERYPLDSEDYQPADGSVGAPMTLKVFLLRRLHNASHANNQQAFA
jgi:hypothetical protein